MVPYGSGGNMIPTHLGLVPRRCLSGLECEEAHLLLEGELRAVLPLRPLRTLLLLRLQKTLLTRVPAKDNRWII